MRKQAALLGSFAVLLVACGGETPPAPALAPSPTPSAAPSAVPASSATPSATPSASASAAAAPAGPPHFSYAGDDGPDHWATLDPSWSACAGTHQSPIDLPAKPGADTATVAFGTYDKFPLEIVNTGHAIQVNDKGKSLLQVDGITYSLAQFHFHVPSEHTVGGKSFAAEVHFVHKSQDGKLAVVGMFVKEGKANKTFADLVDHAPAEKGEPQDVAGSTMDLATILPSKPKLWRYDGSLTVPPCTEGVTWLLVPPTTATLEMSAAQLAKIGAATHAPTNRPVQSLGGRSVSELKSTSAPKR